MQLKVSVIITTRNRAERLRGAMASVLGQTYKDFELIVIDDGSDDETEGVVRACADARVHYIRHEQHLGPVAALNEGLQVARGELIAILDDDDLWVDPRKLEWQVAFLDEHPDTVLVATNIIVMNPVTNVEIARSRYRLSDADIRNHFFWSNPIAHSSVLYRRATALAVGGYDADFPRGKDYDLWMKLAKQGKLAILPDHAVCYRKSDARQRGLARARYQDFVATRRVIWKHRGAYPHFIIPYCLLSALCFLFLVLRVFPFPYLLYRRVKDARGGLP